jgi:hypothetical protein
VAAGPLEDSERFMHRLLRALRGVPPGGYFGRKLFLSNDLEPGCPCKIVILNELRLKYSKEKTYG